MLPTRRLPMHSVHRQCICNIDCCIPFSRQFLVDQISHLVGRSESQNMQCSINRHFCKGLHVCMYVPTLLIQEWDN
jgi:hypothetical protein